MPLLTPRRRFLITAPLALLLPAGLLTYLGLIAIGSVETEYEIMAKEKVESIIPSLRNRTTMKIRELIQTPFENTVRRNADTFKIFPPKADTRFVLDEEFPFASLLFVYSQDDNIYFFKRVRLEDQDEDRHYWIFTPEPSTAFTARLKGKIDSEIEIHQDQSSLESNSSFNHLCHPDPVSSEAQRELAFFTIFYPQISSRSIDLSGRVKAFGLTMDFEYINTDFFQTLLNEMSLELSFPIAIEDRLSSQWVAQVETVSREPMIESRDYLPKYFNEDYFPWYKIHFSSAAGLDVMQTANSVKTVYYCLVAAANIIMILAVLGAVRNISQELALSDLRSNFVARVSHDLRTPLGLIRLYSETLEMDRAKSEEKRKEYLHAITKESERLTHLINNILNFAQIEARKKHYTPIETQLDSDITETVESMRYHLDRHGLRISVEIDPELPLVRCDVEALQQALFNLLSNATKYSGDGKEITVNAYPKNGEAVVEIIDQGIGISSDHQQKIFDEFYRVDDPLVRETGGSGLGLAVVKHIIEGHKGTIDVESEPGWGSKFSIRLPIQSK